MRRFGIVFRGAGGVRGMAHIGVLSELTRLGMRPSCLVGSGMGGLVAALYACGTDLCELANVCASLARPGASLWVRSRRPPWGQLLDYVRDTVGDRLIEDLPIPLHLTAFNVTTCQVVSIHQGPLFLTLRATTALPGFFSPAVDGRGNVIVTADMFAFLPDHAMPERTIFVDTTSDASSKTSAAGKIIRRMSGWIRGYAALRSRLAVLPEADIVLQPVLNGVGMLAFDRVAECMEAGIRAVQAQEERIKTGLNAMS